MVDIPIREAVGVFHDERSLQSAVDDLLIAGFDRSQLSLLAGQHTVEMKLGHRLEKVADLEDDPEVPTRAYVGNDSRIEAEGAIVGGLVYVGAIASVGLVAASGGTALIVAALVGGGAGGLIGAALAGFIEQRHAHRLQEQLDHGGLLLWVRTVDGKHEQRAVDVLKRNGADDVHVHSLPERHYDTASGVSYDMSFMKRLGM